MAWYLVKYKDIFTFIFISNEHIMATLTSDMMAVYLLQGLEVLCGAKEWNALKIIFLM
jgi:hypothetical protein